MTLKIAIGSDLHTSVMDRVILLFCEGLIFAKTSKFHENKTLAKVPEFTVHVLNNASS